MTNLPKPRPEPEEPAQHFSATEVYRVAHLVCSVALLTASVLIWKETTALKNEVIKIHKQQVKYDSTFSTRSGSAAGPLLIDGGSLHIGWEIKGDTQYCQPYIKMGGYRFGIGH